MIGSPKHLHNVHSYNSIKKIQIVDGNTLSIATIGDLNSFFQKVLVSPGLASNLISIDQLVDTNCSVHFSRAGCLVQD
uniref:Retrovirus-related Pol polyprotein from transposon TNT 1-94 n=1 Tax=Cajanus cajan TaxID=3821 RepID=A0A151QVC1_CAJCA|nr:hypothetical protein KK1_044747 [Cajanus cajan]